MSRYISPQDACLILLQTGNKAVLKAVDPNRMDELKKCLAIAQKGLLKKAQGNGYADKVRKLQKIEQEHVNPLYKGVEPWPSGESYHSLCGIRYKYVRLGNKD